jgi:hypothetical protein
MRGGQRSRRDHRCVKFAVPPDVTREGQLRRTVHTRVMMTNRTLRLLALGIALSVQVGMVVTYGMITDWCFCSVTGFPTPAPPPPFVIRSMELATLPAAWMQKGLPVPVLFVVNVEAWFLAMLALLHGMALAARLRIRPLRGETPHARRAWLASRESVRPRQMLLPACLVIAVVLTAGAAARRHWLSQAEQVFAASMAAESAGRPLPAGVRYFSMSERRGDGYVQVAPEPRYVAEVDPHESGDHFFDQFVVPYGYGGVLRFESGRRWEFGVYETSGEWSIYLEEER